MLLQFRRLASPIDYRTFREFYKSDASTGISSGKRILFGCGCSVSPCSREGAVNSENQEPTKGVCRRHSIR